MKQSVIGDASRRASLRGRAAADSPSEATPARGGGDGRPGDPQRDSGRNTGHARAASLVIPDLKKAAFIFGGEYGKGVMSCRAGEQWSAPVFMQLAKGSWGFQAGAEQVDLVLLVMNESGRPEAAQEQGEPRRRRVDRGRADRPPRRRQHRRGGDGGNPLVLALARGCLPASISPAACCGRTRTRTRPPTARGATPRTILATPRDVRAARGGGVPDGAEAPARRRRRHERPTPSTAAAARRPTTADDRRRRPRARSWTFSSRSIGCWRIRRRPRSARAARRRTGRRSGTVVGRSRAAAAAPPAARRAARDAESRDRERIAEGHARRTERSSEVRISCEPASLPCLLRRTALPDDGGVRAPRCRTAPSGPYEVKWDGYRAQARQERRRRLARVAQSEEHHAAVPGGRACRRAVRAKSAVLDGEIVALDADGRPSFQALHHADHRRAVDRLLRVRSAAPERPRSDAHAARRAARGAARR